jgi:hypothetical protein
MRVALNTVIAINKKKPLHEVTERVRRAFVDAGLAEPLIRFTLMDSRKEMSKVLSNVETGEPAEYTMLQAILSGVPVVFVSCGGVALLRSGVWRAADRAARVRAFVPRRLNHG